MREQAFDLPPPRGQPSPGGVVTAQTQQAADDLQAVAPGQPVLVDVPAGLVDWTPWQGQVQALLQIYVTFMARTQPILGLWLAPARLDS